MSKSKAVIALLLLLLIHESIERKFIRLFKLLVYHRMLFIRKSYLIF